MAITLTRREIDSTMPKIKEGLQQYAWLQGEVANGGAFPADPDFQRRFNHFYRVRRGDPWREAFYDLMDRARGEELTFSDILDELQRSTGRLEGSFASKLYATLEPSAPVIDSKVLGKLRLRLPHAGHSDRHTAVCDLHTHLGQLFDAFLKTADGAYLVRKFDQTYPKEKSKVTAEKKLDLVLWKAE